MHLSSGDTIPNCLVPGTPYLTAWANSGKSRRERASRLMAIRQTRLERLALSASGHERMVKGQAATSGEKRIDLSEEIAWFRDILNIDDPLVEIGPVRFLAIKRSVAGSSQRGGSGSVFVVN